MYPPSSSGKPWQRQLGLRAAAEVVHFFGLFSELMLEALKIVKPRSPLGYSSTCNDPSDAVSSRHPLVHPLYYPHDPPAPSETRAAPEYAPDLTLPPTDDQVKFR